MSKTKETLITAESSQAGQAEQMKIIYSFLDELSENNNREWFAANRQRYEQARTLWLAQMQALINAMSAYEPSYRHLEAARCAYRIYRDTRFSPDKTPYKTYFSALLSPCGRQYVKACYYIHLGHAETAIYGGLWCPEPKVLKKVRKAIVDNIDEFRAIINVPQMLEYFPEWEGRQLKTVPKGYDRNDPNADLLRLCEYGRGHFFERSFFDNPQWYIEVTRMLELLKPLNDFLNYSIDEEL